MENDYDWSDYESGPFCRHFGDPPCDIKCAYCEHTCTRHEMTEGHAYCNDCDECDEWIEPD